MNLKVRVILATCQVQGQPGIKRSHLKTTTKRAVNVADLVKTLAPGSDS